MSFAKPTDERAGHHSAPALIEAGSVALVAPALPPRLQSVDDELQARWVAVWTSPVAQVLDPESDLEPMSRLFELYALDRRMGQAVTKQLDWLSDGDPYAEFDPQYARVRLAVAGEIRQLEQTLGITPRGRLVIGAAVAAQTKPTGEATHDDADD